MRKLRSPRRTKRRKTRSQRKIPHGLRSLLQAGNKSLTRAGTVGSSGEAKAPVPVGTHGSQRLGKSLWRQQRPKFSLSTLPWEPTTSANGSRPLMLGPTTGKLPDRTTRTTSGGFNARPEPVTKGSCQSFTPPTRMQSPSLLTRPLRLSRFPGACSKLCCAL